MKAAPQKLMRWVKGTELRDSVQRQCLAQFVHRFTREHVPNWAKNTPADLVAYMVQFASDLDWLAHTEFAVTKRGELDKRVRYCFSSPTWPNGKPASLAVVDLAEART